MKKLLIVIAILTTVFVSACTQYYLGPMEPAMAKVPTIDLEATVVSIFKDTNIACEGKCPGYQYPKDKGTIRIDKIISIDNPDNFEIEGIEEGNEIQVEFYYSAQPAKIRKLPSPPAETGPANTTVSHTPMFANPIPKEDGYFIYEFESTLATEETETVLPGLEEGSKFSATISYLSSDRISIAEYQIIS